MKTLRISFAQEIRKVTDPLASCAGPKANTAHHLSDQCVKQRADLFHRSKPSQATPVDLLSRLFKQPINSLEMLGGGDNFVYLVNDAWIFRVPKHESAKLANIREQLFLTEVSRRVTTAIPNYVFWDQDSGSGGYQKIEGGALSSQFYADLTGAEKHQFANDLAFAISEIHSIPVEKVPYLPTVTDKAREIFGKLESSLGRTSFFLKEDSKKLARVLIIAEKLATESTFAPVVLHNDLHCDNIVVNEEKHQLSGIIDFSDARVGPPMIDFCSLYRVSFDLAEKSALIYAQKRDLDAVLFIRACRAWATVVHAASVIVNLQADDARTSRRLIRAGHALNRLMELAPAVEN